MTTANPFTLAADGSPKLMSLLQSQPTLASTQDDHGYSLVHAAASYNHLDLLRSLIREFKVDPNMRDEDGETALFVVETVEGAQVLLDELGCDPLIKNEEGMTAEEKIQTEGDFTVISDFLREARTRGSVSSMPGNTTIQSNNHLSPLPPNVRLQLGTLEDEQSLGEIADPELKQRIESLASRDDFQSEEGQNQLREVIADAVRSAGTGDRSTRPRHEG